MNEYELEQKFYNESGETLPPASPERQYAFKMLRNLLERGLIKTTKTYKHSLNKGMAKALMLLSDFGGCAKLSDLKLTVNQHNNFQKLQYWHLVAKEVGTSNWHITDYGYRFLNGGACAKFAHSLNGKTVGRSGDMVSIKELLPEYQRIEDYV